MKFSEYIISREIKQAIEELGYKRPTDIQYKAIPSILKRDDVMAIAQTGTGKTAAFAIPILDILQDFKERQRRKDGIKCLVMVPTRELAVQIKDVFDDLGKYTPVKTYAIFGGVEQDRQIAKLQAGFDILIATPGRMFDLVSQGHIDLHRVNTLVLDEADHMLDLGFIKDIRDLMTHLPEKRQTLFFSATIDKEIKKLAYSLVYKPIRIQISPNDKVAKNIDHSVAFVEMDDKRFFLERIIKENIDSKILIFVRTKVRAERVKSAMDRVDIVSETLHGDKLQSDRLSTLENFKSGKTKVLIATDVSARGIDIPKVEYVVNYDLPEQFENYVHRVGRTGRGKNKGYAVSFCSNEEKPLLNDIEEYLAKPIEVLKITNDSYKEVLPFSDESHSDWKTLLKEDEDLQKEISKIKKKRRKKK